MEELQGWHLQYAAKLLGTPEEPNMSNVRRCCDFLSYDIEMHEQFAGAGTAGWSLHLAACGLREHMCRLAGGAASVRMGVCFPCSDVCAQVPVLKLQPAWKGCRLGKSQLERLVTSTSTAETFCAACMRTGELSCTVCVPSCAPSTFFPNKRTSALNMSTRI